ncbi:hypothetical protein BGZ76_008968, partial [Entomortierella beljakovae]
IFGSDIAKYQCEIYNDNRELVTPEKQILGKDWVCLNLTKLKIFFDMSSSEMSIDQSTKEAGSNFKDSKSWSRSMRFDNFRDLENLKN